MCCFAPIEDADARVLILGSMPGEASLQAQRYYEHPQNAFWRILGQVVGFDPVADYDRRLSALRDAGIAVWDVLAECVRPGSLDASIERSSIRINDFAGWFARHPELLAVAFNGGTAEALFRKHVLGRIELPAGLRFARLPSTSPANAGLRFEQKLVLWQGFLEPFLDR